MASVALARGINANILHRWVHDAEDLPTCALEHAAMQRPPRRHSCPCGYRMPRHRGTDG